MNRPDWIAIGVYALTLLGIAIHHSRQMCWQNDIFLAGRSMSRWPIAISMYMAVFSTNTFKLCICPAAETIHGPTRCSLREAPAPALATGR